MGVNLIKYSELSSNRIDENYYWAQRFFAFFGDKIAILTMKMIFYKQLAKISELRIFFKNPRMLGFGPNLVVTSYQIWKKTIERLLRYGPNRHTDIRTYGRTVHKT